MKTPVEVKIGSTLCRQIEASRLSERERGIALNAMGVGEAMADAIYAVVRAVREAQGRVFGKHRRAGAAY